MSAVYVQRLGGNQYLWQCRSCDWAYLAEDDAPIAHECDGRTAVHIGYRIEKALKSWGITQEWWVAFKQKHGYPPICSCPQRIIWFNEFGEQLPPVLRWTAVKLLELVTRVERTIHGQDDLD